MYLQGSLSLDYSSPNSRIPLKPNTRYWPRYSKLTKKADSKIWERSKRTSSFNETRSDTLADLSTQTLTELAPGNYVMEMQLEDKNSGATVLRKRRFKIRDFRGSVASSDLLFADNFEMTTRKLSPYVASAIGSDRENIIVFYEI